jgi:hypothetical protein
MSGAAEAIHIATRACVRRKEAIMICAGRLPAQAATRPTGLQIGYGAPAGAFKHKGTLNTPQWPEYSTLAVGSIRLAP